MNDSSALFLSKEVLKMYDSLHLAINSAGGSSRFFEAENLNVTTVMDLFSRLATNGVRFYCEKTHVLVKRKGKRVEKGTYEDLEKELRNLPDTWYPAMIAILVETSHKKKIWIKGGVQNYVNNVVKRLEEQEKQK